MLQKFIITSIAICVPFLLSAQASIHTSGGNVVQNSGSVSYSIGQIFYQQKDDTETIIKEGVQQVYEVITTYSAKELNAFDISVFPNPTKDWLNISFSALQPTEELNYRLFNVQGQLIEEGLFNQAYYSINLSNYQSSLYLLEIYNSDKKIQTYKIIKNQ